MFTDGKRWIKDPLVTELIAQIKALSCLPDEEVQPRFIECFRTPHQALAWKRMLMAVGPHPELDSQPDTKALAAAFFTLLPQAVVVFVSEEMGPILDTLQYKASETLSSLAANVQPSTPPLPFECIFIMRADYGHISLIGTIEGRLIQVDFENGEKLRLSPLGPPAAHGLHTLLTEKVAALREERPNRQFRKQARAAGLPDESVQVLYLRPVQHEKGVAGDGGSSIAYHSRWAVRGHWRNHWFSSTQEHRLLWIDPHLKGPEGAPFKETVRAVVR